MPLLLHWTGARISDAVLIGPGMVGRDGVLAYRQGKTGGAAYVPWTCALPDYAKGMEPDRDMMHRALAAMQQEQMTLLATARGVTRSDKALGTMIREAAIDAKVAKTAHGLRKSRAVSLAESGATTLQIGAWTGHTTLKEISHYTESMDRRRAVTGTEQRQNVVKSSGQGVKSG
ncbi:tyrosine-type recombinase/integrase [Phaeobacter sp. J2-8]|uniref:tyrosine-type recombinase/integrase n=1 Tax=Phaeobacter sp. J2-8 TaxID=2931394 RepID=UPI001FD42BEF|nr:tyrosine-type recombinase/integrase [Phaeobacter sp. J2-8]MCJ7871677.1 tyrosine-type recombinase/integrase [Phaeobacter sp. J2-8]